MHVCHIYAGLLAEMEINYELSLKKIRPAGEWAGDDKKYKQIKKKKKSRTAKRGRKRKLAEVEKGRNTSAKNMQTLTLSNVVKGPLVVLEKRVAFDLIHSSAAQTNLPAHSNGTNRTVSRASSVSTKKTHPCSSPPPTTVISMSSQAHGPVEGPQRPARGAAKSTGGHWSLL